MPVELARGRWLNLDERAGHLPAVPEDTNDLVSEWFAMQGVRRLFDASLVPVHYELGRW